MNSKKRRLRPTAVLAMILFFSVIVFATIIVVDVLGGEKENVDEQQEQLISEKDEDVNAPDITDDTSPENDVAPEDDLPSITEEIPQINEDAPSPVYSQQELLSMYPDTVLKSTDDAGAEYINEIYFVGDSTTHGMAYYGVLEGGKETDKVWTPRSGTLAMWNLLSEKVVMPPDDSELTIPEAVELTNPKRMILTLGVNGVSSCSKEQFVGYYKSLIDEIKSASEDTVIILQSIYPVCSDYQYVNSISMEKINNANSWIAELAHENGCYYLNTASVLVDESGYLNPSYSNGDGIHISPEGFSVILEYIRTHAVG
jgi:hypothetical protein